MIRRSILALLATLVLVLGAFAINRRGTEPPPHPRELPNLNQMRLH